MDINRSYVCKHINLFEVFDTKEKKLNHLSITSFLLCVLPSFLPHWLWIFSTSMLISKHIMLQQVLWMGISLLLLTAVIKGQHVCLKVPLEFAESDSEFPATATFYNSPLPCWPKYLPFLKHTNYICDANTAPARVCTRFTPAELLLLAYFSE